MSEPGPARCLVRDASRRDAEACSRIYAPYVTDTMVSFEAEPPDPTAMTERIDQARRTHAWLVLEDAGHVVGYAYGQPHNPRAAYRWACQVSVYLELGRRRSGAGRRLYEALFSRLVERGFLVALAGITVPNEASEGLHRALGFELVGTYRGIGWKHGTWCDVAWYQRTLAEPPAEPC
jgi:L-amino acid N-acyltransferase YncA